VIVPVPDLVAIGISSLVWAVGSLAIGWWAARRPPTAIHAGPVTRLRPWEHDGRTWQRLTRVSRWKDRLPEAGAVFGGMSKRSVGSRGTDEMQRFATETVRAEKVHWALLATTPLHAIWCRPTIFLGMVAYGLVANVPFIVVQRANRGRIDRIVRRRRARGRVALPAA
jgi:glycosyl-4,4'-diaponeurosporenoate acyltransferase